MGVVVLDFSLRLASRGLSRRCFRLLFVDNSGWRLKDFIIISRYLLAPGVFAGDNFRSMPVGRAMQRRGEVLGSCVSQRAADSRRNRSASRQFDNDQRADAQYSVLQTKSLVFI